MNIEKEIHLLHSKFGLLEAKVNSFHYATQNSKEGNAGNSESKQVNEDSFVTENQFSSQLASLNAELREEIKIL